MEKSDKSNMLDIICLLDLSLEKIEKLTAPAKTEIEKRSKNFQAKIKNIYDALDSLIRKEHLKTMSKKKESK